VNRAPRRREAPGGARAEADPGMGQIPTRITGTSLLQGAPRGATLGVGLEPVGRA
jgi:hypothetical protein